MFKVGVDVGGTFTDCYGIDNARRIFGAKVSTTPEDLSIGVMNSLEVAKIDVEKVDIIVHGTTVLCNTYLAREYYGWWPKVALITTVGCRDTLELGYGWRKSLYDPYQTKPAQIRPIVKRRHRYTVLERMDADGQPIHPLDEDAASRLAKKIRDEKYDAVAIGFLNSYVNPRHEIEMKNILEKYVHAPEDFYIVSSFDTRPKIREYPRFLTTVLRAIMLPIFDRYLRELENRLEKAGFKGGLLLVRGDGGVATASHGRRAPEEFLLSGQAASALGAFALSKTCGLPNALTQDEGGTTWLVSMIENGSILETTESEIEFDMPISVPSVYNVSIGAGGGQIAWIDVAGALRVGPVSAGARPGPACYGMGGKKPTVTDANLVLGRLEPTLGGKMKLHKDLSEQSIKEMIGDRLGLDTIDASDSIIRIVCENMSFADKLVTVDRGRDPRDFVPIVFGGAGPMHICFVAESIGIRRALVAGNAGLTSAFGIVFAPVRHDVECTFYSLLEDLNLNEFNKRYEELEGKATDLLKREGLEEKAITVERRAEMRYVGQQYEVMVPIPQRKINKEILQEIQEEFHKVHEKEYFTRMPENPVCILNLRVIGSGLLGEIELPEFSEVPSVDILSALKGRRPVFFEGEFIDTEIFDWEKMQPKFCVEGPSIVEMPHSTLVLKPGWRGTVDNYKNIVIER